MSDNSTRKHGCRVFFPITWLEMRELPEGKSAFLWSPEYDKSITTVEIHPPESTSCLVFGDGKIGTYSPSFLLSQIVTVESISDYDTPDSRKSSLLQITIEGEAGQRFRLKIAMEEAHIDPVVNNIEALTKIDKDPNYWEGHSITFPASNNKSITTNIYHLTPFLADEEEIIWIRSRNNNINKIVFIDVLTNFRILQYDYEKHNGRAILIFNLKEVQITNEENLSLPVVGSYSEYAKQTLNMKKTGTAGLFGDTVFTGIDGTQITFKLVNDPQTMTNITFQLREESRLIEVGRPIELADKVDQERQIVESLKNETRKILSLKNTNTNCSSCGN